MRAAWRVAAVRAAEEALMATLPDGALMQRAAAGLARRCAELLPGVYGSSVLLLVGSGNNGGDALYAGARLAHRGARVYALLTAPDRAHPGGLRALRDAGGSTVDELPSTVDLIVDGLLGIGGRGGLRGTAASTVERLPAGVPVVAVDLPSGVDADTGAVPGAAVRADVTVAFGALKPGLVVGTGAVHSGLVEVVDIGLSPWLRGEPALRVPDLADIAADWPQPSAGDDKYTRGVVGLATGSAQYTGAALMSVSGALAGPAGMVRYAGAAAGAVREAHPSTIVSDRVADAGRVQAWTCGSGLGTDGRAAAGLRAVLASDVPVCVDADGLTLLADGLTGLLRDRAAPTVLTPHDREFARLAGEQPGPDRVGAALGLATRLGAVVLLKGDRTVVASPSGQAYVNPTGTPALATAGTGDVLAGLLGSLLAAGVPADLAALAAAYAHGLAGRYAAGRGPVTAVDVADALPPALARAGLWHP